MQVCYFAYGSNMNPARMAARGLRYSRAVAATLEGFQLRFNKQSHSRPTVAYANIVPASQTRVEGVLYSLASDAELLKMDVFEGTPVRYSRERLAFRTAEGLLPGWVYVANPAFINNALLPEENYLRHLLSGAEFLSPAYLATLKAHRVQPSEVCHDGELGLRFNV